MLITLFITVLGSLVFAQPSLRVSTFSIYILLTVNIKVGNGNAKMAKRFRDSEQTVAGNFISINLFKR